MSVSTTPNHLFQTIKYRRGNGLWRSSFKDVILDSNESLSWDVSGLLGILSFGYACSDRTVFNEIKRQPWLSDISNNGNISLASLPEHGFLWKNPKDIAMEFRRRLFKEAASAIQQKDNVYLLLSGGMDSRVIAGVVYELFTSGFMKNKPIAVTWGLDNSRDVYYGKQIAKMLGFDWTHIPFSEQHLASNIKNLSFDLAAQVSPINCHRMDWFSNVPSNSIVLAASYGDMVGRGEFSGKHLLELDYLKPDNKLNLMSSGVYSKALQGLNADLNEFRKRFAGQHKYIVCEHEMHCHYTRGMLAQTMSIINNWCSVYQMFTHPDVYGYIWSIHPGLRGDRLYHYLLESIDSRLSQMPWARTNRALLGASTGTQRGLCKNFHEYPQWISGPLFKMIDEYVDPDWFSEQIGFNKQAVGNLRDLVSSDPDGTGVYGRLPHEKWVWLASLRILDQHLKQLKANIQESVKCTEEINVSESNHSLTFKTSMKNLLIKIKPLYSLVKIYRNRLHKLRRLWLIHRAKYLYPPKDKK